MKTPIYFKLAPILLLSILPACNPVSETYTKNHMVHDAIELDKTHQEIFSKIDDVTTQRLGESNKQRGYIHKYWETKQKILKEEHGIDWKTPAELNPQIIFD